MIDVVVLGFVLGILVDIGYEFNKQNVLEKKKKIIFLHPSQASIESKYPLVFAILNSVKADPKLNWDVGENLIYCITTGYGVEFREESEHRYSRIAIIKNTTPGWAIYSHTKINVLEIKGEDCGLIIDKIKEQITYLLEKDINKRS